MSENPVQGITDLNELKDALQRSNVKIETNSKGMAQVKVSVCAGETPEEMDRLSKLALQTYDEMNAALGRRAQFGL